VSYLPVLQEGWQPSTFSSSRSAPAGQRQQQSVEQFMDEDELEEMQKKGLSLKVRAAAVGSVNFWLVMLLLV
jgi:hypothetical protein